jgi:hypothetical protein
MTRSRLCALCALALAAVLSLAAVTRAGSQNVLGECELTFDDAGVLGALPDQAAWTFAPNYRMSCSSHFLNVEPMNVVTHFHLSFEDPNISCPANNGFGKLNSNNVCVPVDWDNEPRMLQSHVQDQWIKIWMEDGSSHQHRPFDLRRIHVGGGPAIRLWFQKQDGSWWFWNQLNGGKNWKVEQWTEDVLEVRIRGTNSGFGSYTIHNAYVRD